MSRIGVIISVPTRTKQGAVACGGMSSMSGTMAGEQRKSSAVVTAQSPAIAHRDHVRCSNTRAFGGARGASRRGCGKVVRGAGPGWKESAPRRADADPTHRAQLWGRLEPTHVGSKSEPTRAPSVPLESRPQCRAGIQAQAGSHTEIKSGRTEPDSRPTESNVPTRPPLGK